MITTLIAALELDADGVDPLGFCYTIANEGANLRVVRTHPLSNVRNEWTMANTADGIAAFVQYLARVRG